MVRALTFLATAVIGQPAAAACQLALALALDVSSSVDQREYQLQRDGLAAALLSDDVQTLLFASRNDWVSIAVYEWSGRFQQQIVLDWTALTGPEALTNAVEQIARTQRSYNEYPTAIGYALGYGATLMERAPYCERRTIDMSGDGINNDGFSPALAYNAFPFADVTVNGLVVGSGILDVNRFYLREVIRGPLAFVETARSYDDFESAMRRKLLREIGVTVVGALPLPPDGGD